MSLDVVNAFVDGGRLIVLHREGGVLKRQSLEPEYSCFVRTAELPPDFARMLRGSRYVRAMKEEGQFTRIVWADKWTRRDMLFGKRTDGRLVRSPLQEIGIPTFEGDVDPVRRFFTDTGARVAKPRRGFFDLETDSRVRFHEKTRARVLTWALSDEHGDRIWSGVLQEFSDAAERDLLEEFFARCEEFDQLLAWNGDGFDFPVLFGEWKKEERRNDAGRVDRLGIAVDPRRWLKLDHLKLFKKMNTASESGEEKTSLKLNAVAFALLGEGKDEFDASKTYEEWAAGGERRARLLAYNEQDTRLLPKIEKKTGSCALFDVLADVCRVLPDSRGLAPTQQMDGFMLRLAMERGFRFATKEYSGGDSWESEEDQYKGAFVLHPRTGEGEGWTAEQAKAWRAAQGMTNGIARSVHVADFASLYPSIILTWNMSPDTKVPTAPINGPILPGTCRSPSTGIVFRTDAQGILPAALDTMIKLRKEWNDRKAACAPGTPEFNEADRRSTAYKVAANSFYGVLGNKYSRFYDREIAESVTQNGVWLIKRTIAEAEARGMAVVYGDTDSFFAVNASQDEFDAFVGWCNRELYPKILNDVGCTVKDWQRIKLAYEKAFDRVVFVSAKRYAGRYLHYKGTAAKKDSKPEIRGLEYRRGDAARLARKLQERAILALMNGEESVEAYRTIVTESLAHVLNDDLPLEDVQISKSLSKDADDYGGKKKADGTDAAVPPHVQVARAENAKGGSFREGDRVPYYVIDGSDGVKARLAAHYQNDADRFYLWENLVYPPTMRLLQAAFPDQDWSTGLECVRPPKPRAKRGKTAAEEQGSLFTMKADPAREATRLVLPEEWFDVEVAREVVALLVKNPGPMTATVLLRRTTGAEAVIASNVKTKAEAVERFRDGIRKMTDERERIVMNQEIDAWRV